MQPDLQFHTFPQENQTLHIRHGSYAFTKNYFSLCVLDVPPSPGISYNKNFNNETTFTMHPVWEHEIQWSSYSTYLSSSNFENVVFSIGVARNSEGIMMRFIFPIAVLVIISGFIFWSHPEDRVNLTVTLLLSVAALYVVVIDNIPLVGYLTSIESMLCSFSLYSVAQCCSINCTTHSMTRRCSSRTISTPTLRLPLPRSRRRQRVIVPK